MPDHSNSLTACFSVGKYQCVLVWTPEDCHVYTDWWPEKPDRMTHDEAVQYVTGLNSFIHTVEKSMGNKMKITVVEDQDDRQ